MLMFERMRMEISFYLRRCIRLEHAELMRELNRILQYLFDDEPNKKEDRKT
jgi:hypothetical protein